MPAKVVTCRYMAIQYLGNNGTECASAFGGSVFSDNGSTLRLTWDGMPPIGSYAVQNGEWLIWREYGSGTKDVFGNVTDSYYQRSFSTFADVANTAQPVIAAGQAAVPTLAGNTQTTVQVTIKPGLALPYSAAATLAGGVTLLASLSVLSCTPVNTTRVDVVVRNTGVLSLGGAVVVVNAVVDA